MQNKTLKNLLTLCFLFVLSLVTFPIQAENPKTPNNMITQGILEVLGQDGKAIAQLPLKHTKVIAEISGFISEVTVTQIFQNPSKDPIEAIYVFPLPQNAAVNEMIMKIGDRIIKGNIKLRNEAKQIYEQAKQQGKVASLLDQERPNIFTQSVANIMPGNEIEIIITYVETLPYQDGHYEFMFPMVVGPRFVPENVVDVKKITPPYLPPTVRSGHDIEVVVTIDAGVPIHNLQTQTHQVKIEKKSESQSVVTLQPFDSIPNKDFVLRYEVADKDIKTGFLTHRSSGKNGFFTLIVPPLKNPSQEKIAPKEMVFVVDTSGSMSGEPIAKVKEAMRHALKNMNPDDTFKIILFSTKATELASEPLKNTPENVQKGLAFIDQINAGGGTLMMEGVKAALDFGNDPKRLRMVLFMTDGYIGNENEIIAAIEDKQNKARVFSFGVGSSVNRYLLDEMARAGRGVVTYVTLNEDSKSEIEKFYQRISKPLLTDLKIETEGVELTEIYPKRIPDLFDTHPLVVYGQYTKAGHGIIRLKGKLGGKPWQKEIEVTIPEEQKDHASLASIWARQKISDLSRQNYREEVPEVIQQITQVALEYQLMSAYTSFVAVEEKVINDGKNPPTTIQVPLEMPQGVSYNGVFGSFDGERKKSGMGHQSPSPSSGVMSLEKMDVDDMHDSPYEASSLLEVEIIPASHVFKMGEEVIFNFKVTNKGKEDLEIDLSPEKLGLTLVGSHGKKLTPYQGVGKKIKVAFGQTLEFTLNLKDFFKLETQGIYVAKITQIAGKSFVISPIVFRIE